MFVGSLRSRNLKSVSNSYCESRKTFSENFCNINLISGVHLTQMSSSRKSKNQKATSSNSSKSQKTKNEDEGMNEKLKILIHKEIELFLQSFDECIEFPSSLTKSQRAYVHEYVKKLGLLSKSYGKGDKRYLTIYKRVNKSSKTTPWLRLTQESRKSIKQYFQQDDFSNFDSINLESLILNNDDGNNVKNAYNLYNNSNHHTVNMGDLLRLNSSLKIPPRTTCPRKFIHEKRNLPIYQYREYILHEINRNQVIIINGETGSGKTTQIPQYILEDSYEKQKPCRIICTQPRRMATVTIAERVTKERGEKLGSTVGFQIRLERCYSRTSNLIYTTSGCLLRSFMANVTDTFHGISHIIIDEIHERDKNTDFILITLRNQLNKNKKLKVILMSATMDIELLSNYFGGCHVITVPGRCYETKIYYLEEILYCTEYRTQKMKEYIKKLKFINAISSPLSASPSKSLEKVQLNSENRNINLDNETQNYVDEIIEKCCNNLIENDENFAQLLYLIESENIPIDIRHSKTLKTPLIVSAQMNNYEYVEKFLYLNSNLLLYDCNGMTALKYSEIYPDRKCYKIINEFLKVQQQQQQQHHNHEKQEHQPSSSSEIRIDQILEAYQKQFNDDDEIDHNLLTTLIKMIHNSQNFGSILVFLPGYNDILIQREQLMNELKCGTYKIFLLHSNMKIDDQKNVLEKLIVRKIILSTNIGETSITFPDVVFVIDCGKTKMNTYDSITGTSYLNSIWISKACAQQRSGRAGRTQTGICYRMYSRQKYESFDKFSMPEFLRIPLTEICLYAKAINKETTISSYLSNALNPPSNVNITNAVHKLKIIGALDDYENMTILGQHLVDLPVEVQLGKCLLYAIWMKCLNPILTIAAFHSVKDPFILPSERCERGKASSRRKLFSGDTFSDHIGIINLYKQWKKCKRTNMEITFCNENYLTALSLDMIYQCRQQIYDVIRRKYQLNDEQMINKLNVNSDNWQIIHSCLISGLYPNICYIERNHMKITSRLERSIAIHPSSVLKPSGYRELKQYINRLEYDWIVFFEKTRINRFGNIRYNTLIPPIIIALFCGRIPIRNKEIQTTIDCNSIKKKNDEEEVEEENDGNHDHENDDDDDDQNNNEHHDECQEKLIIDDWIEFYVCPDDKEVIEKLKMKINLSFMEFLKNDEYHQQQKQPHYRKQHNRTSNNNKKSSPSSSLASNNENEYDDDDDDELITIIRNLFKNEITNLCSMDLTNSYIKSNEKGSVMNNIGYFKL